MWARSRRPPGVILVALAAWLAVGAGQAWAEEVTAPITRFKEREMSTGFYEEYEVKPRRMLPYVPGGPQARQGTLATSPTAFSPLVGQARQADAHQGIKYYDRRSCAECHPEQARSMHTTRAGITCRQCHGGEPMASVEHYYSPLNPIRRHAYVCSKCHAGAGASFATYVVHEPMPASLETRKSFPLLFYVFWIMVALAGGTFALFLPHAIVWGVRELFSGKERRP